MYLKQLPIFKELTPYSGKIDENNRWIKLAKLVPWDELEVIYMKHFDERKRKRVKSCRLITGLTLGQMLMKLSNVQIVEYFHENPYFQFFCGQDTFVAKTEKAIIHHSLLSKRRSRLGKSYMSAFEKEVLGVLLDKGLINGNKLILDATVFPSNISYPNDVQLLNTVREWFCQTILTLKNAVAPQQKIRTYRRVARKVYLDFQKTKKKTKKLIRNTRNKLLRHLKRNMAQLESVLEKAELGSNLKEWMIRDIKHHLSTAKIVYDQQLHMATTRGRRVANRIVNFRQPQIRPIIRGKNGKAVEFGVKAQIGNVDGYGILDDCQFEPFHEGARLPNSLQKHEKRFDQLPNEVLADQLYASRDNRSLLNKKGIEHSFRPVGRPPDISKQDRKKQRSTYKTRQGQRNRIEGLFGHLKSHFYLDKIRWTVPNGAYMQVQLGLIAHNLQLAATRA